MGVVIPFSRRVYLRFKCYDITYTTPGGTRRIKLFARSYAEAVSLLPGATNIVYSKRRILE